MLLAKLTLCSHGNGSCWSRVKRSKNTWEKWIEASSEFMSDNLGKYRVIVHQCEEIIFNSIGPSPHTLNTIRDKRKHSLSVCAELSCSLETVCGGRRGARLFKFHLGVLYTAFPIPCLGRLTCQPAHYRTHGPLSVQSLLEVSHLPHHSELQTPPTDATERFLCSAVEEESKRVKWIKSFNSLCLWWNPSGCLPR